MFQNNILFLNKIYISQIKSVDELAESYFTRNLNIVNYNEDIEEYNKIPETYSTLNPWEVRNILCYETGLLLNGPHRHPFIPIAVKKTNTILHDNLNKINIKPVLVAGKKQKTYVIDSVDKNVTELNTKGEEYYEMKTYGIFYNFNVALYHINNSKWSDNVKWERINLLGLLHKIWYNKPMDCLGIIPSKYLMKMYGGSMEIKDYVEDL